MFTFIKTWYFPGSLIFETVINTIILYHIFNSWNSIVIVFYFKIPFEQILVIFLHKLNLLQLKVYHFLVRFARFDKMEVARPYIYSDADHSNVTNCLQNVEKYCSVVCCAGHCFGWKSAIPRYWRIRTVERSHRWRTNGYTRSISVLFRVVVGAHNRIIGGTTMAVSRVVNHPAWSRALVNNDISMVQTEWDAYSVLANRTADAHWYNSWDWWWRSGCWGQTSVCAIDFLNSIIRKWLIWI